MHPRVRVHRRPSYTVSSGNSPGPHPPVPTGPVAGACNGSGMIMPGVDRFNLSPSPSPMCSAA